MRLGYEARGVSRLSPTELLASCLGAAPSGHRRESGSQVTSYLLRWRTMWEVSKVSHSLLLADFWAYWVLLN